MNPGTAGGGMMTRIGDNGLFMVGAHVAHDCQIGDHVVMANNATLAGHVVIEDYDMAGQGGVEIGRDRKSTLLNSSHANISYSVFCLKKKKSIDALYMRKVNTAL